MPSYYAAQTFDAINMIDDAVQAVHGDVTDRKGMVARLAKAEFASVRGRFTYNTNHFPIENFYLLKIEKDAEGQYVRRIQSTVFTDHKDAYYTECQMKPLQ